MEMKPEVVVLSAKDVEREGLQKLLSEGQDDAQHYEFRFVDGLGTKFPQELLNEINLKSTVIFLWDPSPKRKYTLECFKQMLLAMKGRTNLILFCQTGEQDISDENRTLLNKWLNTCGIPEKQFFIINSGIGAESEKIALLHKIFECCGIKKLEPVALNETPAPMQKGFFEHFYQHEEVSRNHSRQKRADFIKTNFNPDAQGQFSVEQLMQLFAVYMSTPLGSELSKTIEKVLAKALMSEAENTEYLAKIDSGRSTVMGKGWDWVAKKLRELLVARFTAAHKDINFDRVMNTLVELQNCVTSQETAWGYKLWGGEEQVQLVGATIENTMNVMMRMYPCLLKSEITAADLPALKIGGLQLPTEVVDIIDKLFVKPGNGLGM